MHPAGAHGHPALAPHTGHLAGSRTMTCCWGARAAGRMHDLGAAYERAFTRDPTNVELAHGAFQACVREFAFVKQQQVGLPPRTASQLPGAAACGTLAGYCMPPPADGFLRCRKPRANAAPPCGRPSPHGAQHCRTQTCHPCRGTQHSTNPATATLMTTRPRAGCAAPGEAAGWRGVPVVGHRQHRAAGARGGHGRSSR